MESENKLKKNYSDKHYILLRDSILAFLQVSNCKRAGEVERMTFDDLETVIIKNDHCRLEIRGKRTKPVPLVLKKHVWDKLQMLISNRRNAKISKNNRYIFATIHDNNSHDFKYVSACQVLRKFAEACGAEMPETLRGTLLRKQVATHGGEVGLSDTQVNHLSIYLGHTKKIHEQNYRQSLFERDVDTSELIQRAQGVKQEERQCERAHLEEHRMEMMEENVSEVVQQNANCSDGEIEQPVNKNQTDCKYYITFIEIFSKSMLYINGGKLYFARVH